MNSFISSVSKLITLVIALYENDFLLPLLEKNSFNFFLHFSFVMQLTNMLDIVSCIAYYNYGYFNARIVNANLFGKHLSPLKIQLGENKNNIGNGKVNRAVTNSYSPRIIAGVEYTKWIQENFKQGEYFKVTVIKQDFIKLTK